jgi:hypothetical protein
MRRLNSNFYRMVRLGTDDYIKDLRYEQCPIW